MPGPRRGGVDACRVRQCPIPSLSGRGYLAGVRAAEELSTERCICHTRHYGAMLALSMVLNTAHRPGSAASTSPKPTRNCFNKASKVALVRHDGKTVMTMANDIVATRRSLRWLSPYRPFWNATRFTSVSGLA